MTTYEMITDMIRTIALISIAVYLIVTINLSIVKLKNRIDDLEKKVNNDKD